MIIKTDIYENDWIKSKHKKYIMQACIYLEKNVIILCKSQVKNKWYIYIYIYL
jgi:hypothetical protein